MIIINYKLKTKQKFIKCTIFSATTKSPHLSFRLKIVQLIKKKRVLCWSIYSILLVYSTSPSPLVLLQNPTKVWCYFARDPNLLAEVCCEKVYSLLSEKCAKPAKSHQSKCFENSDNHTYFVYSEYKLRFWSEDDSPLVRPTGQTAQVVVTHQKETCRI